MLGSYLAPLVIAEALVERPGASRHAVIRDPALTADPLHLLQDVAHQAITDSGHPK